MNIEQLEQYQWFLARYITGGRNRELLFSWLSEQHIVPWTPLAGVDQYRPAPGHTGTGPRRHSTDAAPGAGEDSAFRLDHPLRHGPEAGG